MSDIREAFEALNKYRKAYDEMYQMLGIFLDADEGLEKPDIDEAWAAFNLAPGPVYWKAIEAALSANGGEEAPVAWMRSTPETMWGKNFFSSKKVEGWTPLYTHPAPPSVAVPEGKRVARWVKRALRLMRTMGVHSGWHEEASEGEEILAMLTAAPSPDHSRDAIRATHNGGESDG